MKTIVKAVATVTLFSLITRILSFIFKVYLSRSLGAVSMGIYQVALSLFFVLLTLASSGIPLVLSRSIAKYKGQNILHKESHALSAALVITVVICAVLSGVVLILSPFIGGFFASKKSLVCLLLLLPALSASAICNVFRGAMWGKGNFTASSIMETIEQCSRVIFCVVMFLFAFDKLQMTAITFSASCIFACIICVIYYFRSGGRLKSSAGYKRSIITAAAPITFVRASSSLIASALAFVLPFLFAQNGYSTQQSMYLLGASIGMAFPLLYIPNTLVGSLAYVMVPTLSEAAAKKEKTLNKQIESCISFSVIIACMFVPSFISLGDSIGAFLFDNAVTGDFLRYSAWLLIPISLESITSSMMNSLELEGRGLVNYLIGSTAMFAIMLAFFGNFSLFVFSMAFGISLTLSSILDIIAIARKAKINFGFIFALIKGVAFIYPSCFITKTVYSLSAGLPEFFKLAFGCSAGFAFFALLIYVFDFMRITLISGKKSTNQLRNAHT